LEENGISILNRYIGGYKSLRGGIYHRKFQVFEVIDTILDVVAGVGGR
jgi:hypothetical protein